MKQRTSTPKNSKYYITRGSGGLNGAIEGKPTQKGANVLDNCVGFANGRFNESINDPELKGIVKAFKYQLVCDAEDFIESAKRQGLKISRTPVEGGIMVWQKGSTLSPHDGAGHVAFVEAVYDDGTILTSESGWLSWAFKLVRRDNKNGRWGQNSAYKFRGCIINPSIANPKVVPAPPLTVDGIGGPDTIRALQHFVGTPEDGEISGQLKKLAKYHPAIEAVRYGSGGSACVKALQKWLGITADGQWGKATSKALQYCIGVDDDGIFGPASVRALQKFLNANKDAKATIPKKPAASKPAAAAPAPTPTVTASTNAAKIVAKANEYAWPYGTSKSKYSYKKGGPKSAYKTALKKYMGKKAKISRSDCGYFVSTCVRAAGVAKSFKALAGTKASFPKVPSSMQIVHKGKKIPSGFLQPGDIIRYKKKSGQHTMIYMGNGRIAEGQRGNNFPAIKKDTKKYNKSNVKFKTLQVIRAK